MYIVNIDRNFFGCYDFTDIREVKKLFKKELYRHCEVEIFYTEDEENFLHPEHFFAISPTGRITFKDL